MVYTWALKWVPYYDFRAHVYTIRLHGAFGTVCGQVLWQPQNLGPRGGPEEGVTLGLQIAQSRSYLYTLGPKVGIICILGALGSVVYLRDAARPPEEAAE